MFENENLAAENVAENVEQTTEETPKAKTFTQEEVDAIVGKKIARTKAKMQKEYDRKYGELENVLRAGTGKESVEEMTDTFKSFYEQKGFKMPQKPNYTDADIAVLAKADAEEIIRGGFDEVVEEVDRLAEIGAANMTAREKALFKQLAEHRQSEERARELAEIGVTDYVYQSDDFKAFAAKFNPNTPFKDVYDIYRKSQPQTQHKSMGSMKSSGAGDGGVKEYYSPEEARKFSRKDLDNNPALFDAIRRSMQKWK